MTSFFSSLLNLFFYVEINKKFDLGPKLCYKYFSKTLKLLEQTMTKQKEHILVIDDEAGIRFSLEGILEDEGYKVSLAENGEKALEFLAKNEFHLIILDIWLTQDSQTEKNYTNDGLVLLQHIKNLSEYKNIPVIMISGHGTIETAVTALKYGAYDFIEKPLALDAVLNTVNRAFEVEDLKSENKALKTVLAHQKVKNTLIGESPAMLTFKASLNAVAPTSIWVLITGENGTGKEVAAKTIHNASQRADKAFIAVNCAAIPEELIESELFGHEKGSFTGAESRIGKFELANNGTLFLDEIGDMSLKTQAKILRILQEQSFERVGGSKSIQVDVRVLAATNKNLEEAIQEGSFRSDLYYRLRGFPLHLPPLRERASDIPLLITALSKSLQEENGLIPPLFSKESLNLLSNAPWFGNVRELKHFLSQAAILYPQQIIEPNMLAPLINLSSYTPSHQDISPQAGLYNETFNRLLEMDFKSARTTFEAWYLEEKLKECDHNVTKLSESIGLERTYLHKKLKSILDK